MTSLTCRFCSTRLEHTFADLGMSPLANAYLRPEDLARPESFYPLHAYVCSKCFLVQLPELESPEAIFSDYAYFSSYSDSWLEHARRFADDACRRFELGDGSRVVEVASNDGYLLQYFHQRGIPVLGIEPAGNVAEAARERGITTLTEFFGTELAGRLAADGQMADLLVGWNVFAHTPHLNDFTAGLERALAPGGVVVLEFPHVLHLIEENQFDTIYHEHYSYFSFATVAEILAAHGLKIFDVEETPTHGGSLRVFSERKSDAGRPVDPRVGELLRREASRGLRTLEPYLAFGERVKATKRRLLEFLLRAKAEGKTLAGYGAPAKGNTLLNYCGVRSDFLDYTVDRSPHKQGCYLPGTRIPIYAPDRLRETRPDYVLILPWNLRDEIAEQMRDVRDWGGRFLVPIPEVEVFEGEPTMIFRELDIPGVYLLEPERKEDRRGFFARTYCRHELEQRGLDPAVVQCNISVNLRAGTVRGMHWQEEPYAEVKLVRCTAGAIHDVIVDLRPESPTFKQHLGVDLDAGNRLSLYIPKGLAHGFQSLVDDTEIFYQMSEFYQPDHARGVRWNDPAFSISWPLPVTEISDKDLAFPDFVLPTD